MFSSDEVEDVDSKGLGNLKIVPDKDEPHENGLLRDSSEVRPVARRATGRDDEKYNMNHQKRGTCLIIYYSEYDKCLKNLKPRSCAESDLKCTNSAFKNLGFENKVYHNLKLSDLREVLKNESKAEHDNEDCIAIVFMSHGYYDEQKRQQYLWAFDERFKPNLLWKYFTPSECLTLAGKPKLFFIQACRGEKTDKGIQLRGILSYTDGPESKGNISDIEEDYSVASYSDFLKVWASYPGHFAFKSNNNGIRGSVFIHYLAKVLEEDGKKDNLETLLLKVKRRVTIEYESSTTMEFLNHNKQIPCVQSTLIRHVFFTDKVQ
ncbi:UNVERIFIED_CONTAM: hypothetical protein RMT77_000604 [Armadillidium vulgare]